MRIGQLMSKIFLIFIGCILLFGGGWCSALNSFFLITGSFNHDLLLFLEVMTASLVVTGLGWQLVTWANKLGKVNSSNSTSNHEKTES